MITLPEPNLPERLRQAYDFRQDYVVDSTRIRHELGYREIVDEAIGLARTIEWERSSPPERDFAADYAAEDEGLTTHQRQGRV